MSLLDERERAKKGYDVTECTTDNNLQQTTFHLVFASVLSSRFHNVHTARKFVPRYACGMSYGLVPLVCHKPVL